MMITVKAGTLADAILVAATSVRTNKKIVALALSSVRLAAAGDNVTVACFDKAIAVTASFAAEVERPGSVAVSAERLHALVDGFPAKAVIAIDDRMSIASGASRYRLQPIPPADLPALPNVDDQIADIEIAAADCLALLEPLPAADTEGTRYYLGGVFWHSVGTELVGASTNGHTLIRVAVKAGKFFSDGRDLIVPMASAAVLRRLIRQTSPARVMLRRSKKKISIECAEFCLVSPLIDTAFPPYESVIPAASPDTVTCLRADLVAAIARLTAAATTEGPLAALSWSEGGEFYISLARQPLDGADVIIGTACGDVKLAVPLRQLAELVGEMRCARLRLEAGEGGGHLTLHDDAGKLALVTTSTWDFPTTTTTTETGPNQCVRSVVALVSSSVCSRQITLVRQVRQHRPSTEHSPLQGLTSMNWQRWPRLGLSCPLNSLRRGINRPALRRIAVLTVPGCRSGRASSATNPLAFSAPAGVAAFSSRSSPVSGPM